jgi:hypothetical protein
VGDEEELTMKIKKTVTDKVIAANRANSRKSPGPNTGAGKRRAQMNSLKHGFFARELQIAEEDRPEYEALNEELLQQYAPATPMQQIGFDKIVCCCWRCKLALRMESRAVALQQSSNQEPKVEAAGDTNRMDQWYAADYRSLQKGLRFLRYLRADVADCGLLHLEQDGPLKESVTKGFGLGFYNRLREWKGMSIDAISLAEMVVQKSQDYKADSIDFDRPQTDPKHPETPKVVADPRLKWEMAVKIVDAEIEHLETLVQTRRQDFRETPQALAEFSPRYFADASRDLQRAVDWFLNLKEKGL